MLTDLGKVGIAYQVGKSGPCASSGVLPNPVRGVESLDDPPPFDFGILEVDQKTQAQSGGAQIVQTLRGVLVGQTFHALQFNGQDAVRAG